MTIPADFPPGEYPHLTPAAEFRIGCAQEVAELARLEHPRLRDAVLAFRAIDRHEYGTPAWWDALGVVRDIADSYYETGARTMSTEITTAGGRVTVAAVEHADGGWVHISRRGGDLILVRPADLLDAIRTELDVIVIERSGLPEVHAGLLGSLIHAEGTRDPALIRYNALTSLALAEYLDAHPPVDEAQVQALATVLRDDPTLTYGHANGPSETAAIARRLVQRGVRVEVRP